MRTPSDTTVAAWLFAWLTLVYLATAKGVLEYWDDISMLAVTASIVDQGSVAVPASTPGSDPGKDGRYYSQYGIGQSLLAVPFYLAGGLLERHTKPKPPPIIDARGNTRASKRIYVVMTLGMVTSAGAAALLYLTCRALAFGHLASLATAIALGLGTFAWHYARTFMSEPPSMLAALAAFYGLLRFRAAGGRGWLLASGASLGMALLLRVGNVTLTLPLGLWLLWELGERWRRGGERVAGAALLWVLPVAAAVATIALYNSGRFGSVLETSYGKAAHAFDTPLLVGLPGLVASPGKGLFLYAPILVAGIAGWPALRRAAPVVALMAALLVVVHLVFYARYHWWYGGGAWGPRFVVVILPFLALPLAAAIERARGPLRWSALALLGAVSVFVQIMSVLVPYVPYETAMEATPERFERLLWSPSDSPILAGVRSLLRGEHALDIAPTYYGEGWRWISHLQLIALLTACATLAAGLVFGASVRSSARALHETEKVPS